MTLKNSTNEYYQPPLDWQGTTSFTPNDQDQSQELSVNWCDIPQLTPNTSPTGIVRKRKSRRSWPVEVPLPAGYVLYCFEKILAGENCYREYRILYQPTLWSDGQHTVQRSWGRRGSRGQSHQERKFVDMAGAVTHVRKEILRRLSRGYKLVTYEVIEVR